MSLSNIKKFYHSKREGKAIFFRFLRGPIPSDEVLLSENSTHQNVTAAFRLATVLHARPSQLLVDTERVIGGHVAAAMPWTIVADLKGSNRKRRVQRTEQWQNAQFQHYKNGGL